MLEPSFVYQKKGSVVHIKDKNLIAYSFFNSRSEYMTLDVLIDIPFSFDLMWNQREIRKQDDLSINIVSLQHLIDMKKYSDRQQDNDDVLLLTKLLNNA